ncbi:MAG: M28 family peptidase [Bradymonadaceae bacterium]
METTDWIGEVYTSTFGWNVLEDLAESGPRLGASAGERRAHDRVKRAFRQAGLREIEEHTFEMPGWQRESAAIELERPDELDLDCIALPGSPADIVTGEFVYLDYGLPENFEAADLEGKIAVVRSDVPEWYDHWMHRREKYGLAKRHGAAGFVFANHVPGCLPPTGSLGGGLDVIGAIPAVGVSREVGARIERRAQRGEVRGRLVVDAAIDEAATSQNIHGVVGPESDTELLVCAHVDGHDISQAAIDNGAGVAVMCDVARALADNAWMLDQRVRFVGFGAEELGLVGSQHFTADRDLSTVDIAINLDGIGQGRNLLVHDNLFDGLRPIVDRLNAEFRHSVECLREYVVHSDHWPFVWKGIPGAMVSAASGNKGRGFAHTFADTLEKVDVRALRDHAVLASRFVSLLSSPDVEIARRSPEDVRDDLRERHYEDRLRLAGDWPFD